VAEQEVSTLPCPLAPQCGGWVPVLIDPELPALACQVGNHELAHGDGCVVETGDGLFLGRASVYTVPVVREPSGPPSKVVRRATADDEKRHYDLGHLEREIVSYLRRRTRELGLEMRPLKVRLPLTGRKAVVYFTAERRIDFRPLLRELGRRYRRRVEMRPLGVRDGARVTGGLGPCGRCLCCATFMERFHSVTVRMAKRQNLSLNPTKISGLCGRLMCCLAHEVDLYPTQQKNRQNAPRTSP
jgi:cell fate regulator YaaT (PSP1 superfamily)